MDNYYDDNWDMLTEKYGGYASWGIWSQKNSQRTNVGPIYKNKDLLHSKYVLIALNPSKDLYTAIQTGERKPWANFHGGGGGGGNNDSKLKYAINDTILKGLYMTDLFKEVALTQDELLRKVKDNPDEIVPRNIDLLKQELIDVNVDEHTTFILIGGKVQEYWEQYFMSEFNSNPVIRNPHYSARGYSDKRWVEEFWGNVGIEENFEKVKSSYF